MLQHLRTEAASKRSVEMAEATRNTAGVKDQRFRLEIREAVQIAMKTFADSMHVVSDLKVCLFRNRTSTPFLTSDNPAVLTNRWQLESAKTKGRSFGFHSAGTILLLPLSPQILCVGYDGDVYSIPHERGWVDIHRHSDIEALNQHQFLNCLANIFVRDAAHSQLVHEAFLRIAACRPASRHLVHYAVLDRREGEFTRYRVVNNLEVGDHEEALIHSLVVHAKPTSWPRQMTWRPKGFVFTNGTGVGYVRRAWTLRASRQPFRKELASGN